MDKVATAKPPATYLPSELAERWRCSLDAVYRLIHSGQLRAFSVSPPGAKRKSYRVPADAVVQHEAGERELMPTKRRRKGHREPRPGFIEFF